MSLRRRIVPALLLLALGVLSLPPAAHAQGAGVEAARAFRQAHGAAILEDFAGLLSLPSVAGDRPNIRRNAEAIRDALVRRGAAAELWELPGEPLSSMKEEEGKVLIPGFYDSTAPVSPR